MADSRILNLASEVGPEEMSGLINTLYLVVDATGFTEAQKVMVKSLLTEAIVEDNAINYLAMTPKAFYESIMSTTRKGIGMIAADVDVTTPAGTGLLLSVHQILMKAQWKLEWFQSQIPAIYRTNNFATGRSMVFDVTFSTSITYGTSYPLAPTLPVGKTFKAVHFSALWKLDAEVSAMSNNGAMMAYLGGTVQYVQGGITFFIPADGRSFYVIKSGAGSDLLTLSMKVNAVLS